MKISLGTIKSTYTSAKTFLRESIEETRELYKDYNIYNEIRNFAREVRAIGKNGEVHTAGISDDKAKAIIDTSKSGLEAYAKANNLNIIMHTPQKPYEVGSNAYEKPLSVLLERKGGLLDEHKLCERVIDGDVSKNSVHTTIAAKTVNNKEIPVKSTYEDTFLRRVFRTIEELKAKIDEPRKDDSEIESILENTIQN